MTPRWMSAREAAEYLGYGQGRRGIRSLYQATYRIPALRACIVCLGRNPRRGYRFDRDRLDAYLDNRRPDLVRLELLHPGTTLRRGRRVA